MQSEIKENESRMLRARELAQLLAVSERQIWRLHDAGRLPRAVKLGGAVRWDRQEIEKWIAGGCPRVR